MSTPHGYPDPGRELDALVAVRVMGWVRLTEGELYGERFDEVYPSAAQAGFDRTRQCSFWHDPNRRDQHGEPEGTWAVEDSGDGDWIGFHPSTDIRAAWEVVEKIADRFMWLERTDGIWFMSFWFGEPSGGHCVMEKSPSAPHAICLAALKAVGASGNAAP